MTPKSILKLDPEFFEKNKGYAMSAFLKVYEKDFIEQTLIYCRGNQTAAAEILGVNRGTLRKKIQMYKLGKFKFGE